MTEPKTVFVTLCDRGYLYKAEHTIKELRSNGQWAGDIVLIAVDFLPDDMFLFTHDLILYPVTHIDTSKLVESLKQYPLGPSDDGRHLGKLYQWDKLYAFSDFFRVWERVIFLDAGLRTFDTVQPLLDHPWKGYLVAPDDTGPYDNGRRFNCQLELAANPPVAERVLSEFPETIFNEKYFLNCMFMYDTALLDKCGLEELEKGMTMYPVCRCNEMSLMNLYFTFKHKVWLPLEEKAGTKYLFGWSERNYREHPTWKDFYFIKYSATKGF
jgi:hypothetical protein